MQPNSWRLFVAAQLEAEANRELQRWVDLAQPLAGELGLKLRWVPAEQRHLTLQFLGACEPALVEQLARRISLALRARTPIDYSWSSVETFGAPQRARVIFAALRSKGTALDELAIEVREQLRGVGCAPDKPFHGHVTLARLQPQRDSGRLLEAWRPRLTKPGREVARYQLRRVALMRSQLGPRGAHYQTLVQWTLSGM